MMRTSHLEIVPKISKYCNLRCTYCYEYRELGDRTRMQLADVGNMFATLRRHVDLHPEITSVRFAWQGGEPLLIKPDVYRAIAELSERAFSGAPARVSHVVQTNLTVMSPAWLAFLRDGGFFEDIGISFDVIGDRRVDTKGQVRTDAVLANIQALIDARVPFAAIAVMSRFTLPKIEQVQRFFDELGVETRFLPFNQSVSTEQKDAHALSAQEITDAFALLFDGWIASDNATSIEPLREYLSYALNVLEGRGEPDPELEPLESVFIVNTNGDTWGTGDLYRPGAAYGNIFTEEFADMMVSPARLRATAAMRERVSAICGGCPYFGACPGFAVAFSMPDERAAIAASGCTVRAVIDHILSRLEQTGIAETVRHSGVAAGPLNGALALPL
ncbi:MAG: radical SAM protein [Xanthobacteraceae bacterium]